MPDTANQLMRLPKPDGGWINIKRLLTTNRSRLEPDLANRTAEVDSTHATEYSVAKCHCLSSVPEVPRRRRFLHGGRPKDRATGRTVPVVFSFVAGQKPWYRSGVVNHAG